MFSIPSKENGKEKIRCSEKEFKNPPARVKLKASPFSALAMASVRDLLPVAVLITTIILGSKGTTFDLNDTAVGRMTLDIDVQLAAIGLINKFMDMVVAASLRHTAAIILTIWMTARKHNGVDLLDFDLKSELTQPWTCIHNFHKRRKLRGWRGIGWRGILRFIASLAISSCVLILPLAINTIGIPKERWYPRAESGGFRFTDEIRRLMTISTPRTEILGVSWPTLPDEGPDPDALDALAADLAADPLGGWAHVGDQDPDTTTGINTVVGNGTVRTTSIQHSLLKDVYRDFKANSTEGFHRNSIGWHLTLNITAPMLSTTCYSISSYGVEKENTVSVLSNHDASPTDSSFFVSIGPVSTLNFTGSVCHITLDQVLFPAPHWLEWIDGIENFTLSLNNRGADRNLVPVPLSSVPVPRKAPNSDRTCVESLQAKLRSNLNRMDKLLEAGIAHHIVLTARRLAQVNGGFNKTMDPDATSTAPVIAAVAQHLITVASWDTVASTEVMVDSFPVRWRVYGSGPRLAWEWAAVVILVVTLLAVLVGSVFALASRVRPGPWLETAGILLLANQSDVMESTRGSVGGVVRQRAARARYFVRQSADDETGNASLVLLDDSSKKESRRDTSWTRNGTNEARVVGPERMV